MKNPRRIMTMVTATVALTLLSAPLSCEEPSPSAATTPFKTNIRQYLKECSSTGIFSGNVLVAKGKNIVFQEAYGMADYGNEISNTLQTKFWLESVSQHFTAIAIMQLYEQGALRLDDSIANFLSDLPQANRDNVAPVTIAHLLTHKSGISEDAFNNIEAASKHSYASLKDFITEATSSTLEFAPGSKYEYSNTNYLLLSYIIATVSNTPFEQYIQTKLFDPVGMNSSGSAPVGERSNGFAIAYNFDFENEVYEEQPASLIPFHSGHGTIYSTIGDLFLWNQHLFEENAPEKRIIQKATFMELFALQNGIEDVDLSSNIWERWFNALKKFFGFPNRIFRVFGSDDYRTHNAYFLDKKFSVIFLSNTGSTDFLKMSNDLIAMVSDKPHQPPRKRKVLKLADVELDKYVGYYKMQGRDGVIPILRHKKKLYISLQLGKKLIRSKIHPLTRDRFFLRKFPEQEISFAFDEHNNVISLVGHTEGKFFDFDTVAIKS